MVASGENGSEPSLAIATTFNLTIAGVHLWLRFDITLDQKEVVTIPSHF